MDKFAVKSNTDGKTLCRHCETAIDELWSLWACCDHSKVSVSDEHHELSNTANSDLLIALLEHYHESRQFIKVHQFMFALEDVNRLHALVDSFSESSEIRTKYGDLVSRVPIGQQIKLWDLLCERLENADLVSDLSVLCLIFLALFMQHTSSMFSSIPAAQRETISDLNSRTFVLINSLAHVVAESRSKSKVQLSVVINELLLCQSAYVSQHLINVAYTNEALTKEQVEFISEGLDSVRGPYSQLVDLSLIINRKNTTSFQSSLAKIAKSYLNQHLITIRWLTILRSIAHKIPSEINLAEKLDPMTSAQVEVLLDFSQVWHKHGLDHETSLSLIRTLLFVSPSHLIPAIAKFIVSDLVLKHGDDDWLSASLIEVIHENRLLQSAIVHQILLQLSSLYEANAVKGDYASMVNHMVPLMNDLAASFLSKDSADLIVDADSPPSDSSNTWQAIRRAAARLDQLSPSVYLTDKLHNFLKRSLPLLPLENLSIAGQVALLVSLSSILFSVSSPFYSTVDRSLCGLITQSLLRIASGNRSLHLASVIPTSKYLPLLMSSLTRFGFINYPMSESVNEISVSNEATTDFSATHLHHISVTLIEKVISRSVRDLFGDCRLVVNRKSSPLQEATPHSTRTVEDLLSELAAHFCRPSSNDLSLLLLLQSRLLSTHCWNISTYSAVSQSDALFWTLFGNCLKLVVALRDDPHTISLSETGRGKASTSRDGHLTRVEAVFISALETLMEASHSSNWLTPISDSNCELPNKQSRKKKSKSANDNLNVSISCIVNLEDDDEGADNEPPKKKSKKRDKANRTKETDRRNIFAATLISAEQIRDEFDSLIRQLLTQSVISLENSNETDIIASQERHSQNMNLDINDNNGKGLSPSLALHILSLLMSHRSNASREQQDEKRQRNAKDKKSNARHEMDNNSNMNKYDTPSLCSSYTLDAKLSDRVVQSLWDWMRRRFLSPERSASLSSAGPVDDADEAKSLKSNPRKASASSSPDSKAEAKSDIFNFINSLSNNSSCSSWSLFTARFASASRKKKLKRIHQFLERESALSVNQDSANEDYKLAGDAPSAEEHSGTKEAAFGETCLKCAQMEIHVPDNYLNHANNCKSNGRSDNGMPNDNADEKERNEKMSRSGKVMRHAKLISCFFSHLTNEESVLVAGDMMRLGENISFRPALAVHHLVPPQGKNFKQNPNQNDNLEGDNESKNEMELDVGGNEKNCDPEVRQENSCRNNEGGRVIISPCLDETRSLALARDELLLWDSLLTGSASKAVKSGGTSGTASNTGSYLLRCAVVVLPSSPEDRVSIIIDDNSETNKTNSSLDDDTTRSNASQKDALLVDTLMSLVLARLEQLAELAWEKESKSTILSAKAASREELSPLDILTARKPTDSSTGRSSAGHVGVVETVDCLEMRLEGNKELLLEIQLACLTLTKTLISLSPTSQSSLLVSSALVAIEACIPSLKIYGRGRLSVNFNAQLFDAIYQILTTIIVRFSRCATTSLPVIIDIIARLLECLIEAGIDSPHGDAKTKDKQLVECARNMDRLAALLIKCIKSVDKTGGVKRAKSNGAKGHEVESREEQVGGEVKSLLMHLPHLVGRYIVSLSRALSSSATRFSSPTAGGTLDPTVKAHLDEALHRYLTVVGRDRRTVELICERLVGGNGSQRQLFRQVYGHFDKYYRFKGSI